MRITNNMLIANMMRNLNSNYGKMDRIQQQLSTGKKFQLPSDDPIGVAKSLKLNTDIAMIEQYKRNLSDARSWLEVTEDAIAQMGDILHRARELTVQASNGNNTKGDLIQISSEIKQLKKQLIKIGNSTYAGRYLFSGYKTDAPLLDDDGNYKLTNKEVTSGDFNVVANVDVSTGKLLGADIQAGSTFPEGTYTVDFVAANDARLLDSMGNVIATDTICSDTTTENLVFTDGSGNTITVKKDASFAVGETQDIVIGTSGANMTSSTNFDAIQMSNPRDLQPGKYTIEVVNDGAFDDILELKDSSGNVIATYDNGDVNLAADTKYTINLPGGGTITVTTGNVAPTAGNEIEFDVQNSKALDDNEVINYNVGVSDTVAINTIGIRLFGKLDSSGDMTKQHFSDSTVNGYVITADNNKANRGNADKSYLISLFDTIENAMDVDDKDTVNKSLTWIDETMDNLLSIRSDIGAKVNRLELSEQRLETQSVNFTELLSENEEVNMAEIIMKLKNSENVYRASLSIGAKVIQPTLVDFLR